jgi:hypothetical protein
MGSSMLGPASVFIVIAAFALIFFLILANALEFKDDLFAVIFPREQSFAQNQSSSTKEPLRFTSINITNVTPNSVTVKWTTNSLGTSKLLVGQFKDILSLSTRENEQLSVSHEETMSGLEPTTRYYLRAVSRDSSGVEYSSDVLEVTTE